MKGMPVVVARLGLAMAVSFAFDQDAGLDEDRASVEVEAVAPETWDMPGVVRDAYTITAPGLIVALDEDRSSQPQELDEDRSSQPQEDEPGWDCRIHGNLNCGTLIQGTWYIVQFKDGKPVAVWPREEIGG